MTTVLYCVLVVSCTWSTVQQYLGCTCPKAIKKRSNSPTQRPPSQLAAKTTGDETTKKQGAAAWSGGARSIRHLSSPPLTLATPYLSTPASRIPTPPPPLHRAPSESEFLRIQGCIGFARRDSSDLLCDFPCVSGTFYRTMAWCS
jgi:hypothetical protein